MDIWVFSLFMFVSVVMSLGFGMVSFWACIKQINPGDNVSMRIFRTIVAVMVTVINMVLGFFWFSMVSVLVIGVILFIVDEKNVLKFHGK